MNKKQAKKRAHRMVWKALEGQAKIDILECIAVGPETDADQKRLRDAFDQILQEHYNRSCWNIQRARGYLHMK